jgi:tRNA threonylcarbamoyladenosine biosynthesis protein TsaE
VIEPLVVDSYRLGSMGDAESVGIEDILAGDGVVVIEWPERITPLLPPERLWITLDVLDETTQRQLTLRATGPRYETLLEQFQRNAG